MSMPSVSVVIPTYNRAVRVKNAIDSVLSQTAADYEIVVVDDGSTDGTADIIHSTYGSKVILIEQENKGVSAARNTGVRAARGDLIAFLDNDDRWMPEKLQTQLPLMADPEI